MHVWWYLRAGQEPIGMGITGRWALEANIDEFLHVHSRWMACLRAFQDGLLNTALKEAQHA